MHKPGRVSTLFVPTLLMQFPSGHDKTVLTLGLVSHSDSLYFGLLMRLFPRATGGYYWRSLRKRTTASHNVASSLAKQKRSSFSPASLW